MFIVFEGIDGSGKSSVITRLKESLEASGRKVMVTAEPTDSAVGKLVAETDGLNPETEALLFTADRAVTGPTLRKGYLEDIRAGRCGNIFNASNAFLSRSCI